MKRGTIVVESGKPLRFGDPVETDVPPSPEQQHVNLIGDSIKRYLGAAGALLKGKYACYAEFVPQHLQHPCSSFVLRCRDGVFIRHDGVDEGDTRVRVAATNETLAEVAPKLSDFFVHVGTDPGHLDIGEKSPGLTMTVVDPGGLPRQTLDFRLGVFTTGQLPDGFEVPKPPARPICLVSLTNEFVVAMGGVVVPADRPDLRDGPDVQQFLAQGCLKLPVGWQAIEIYPLLADEYWQPEYAAGWAELDILAIAAHKNLRESQLNTLDPRSEARRQYAALLAQFESLLQGPEEPIHQFLLQHPELISPTYDKVWSKVPFGAKISDFVFREPHNDYELVEIEAPGRQLFRQDGQQHAELTHAINQT